MSNTITIELCAEDRKRIDELIGFAGLLVGELKERGPVTMPQHPVDEVSPHAIPEPVAEPEPEVIPEPELPKYTTADILAKVQTMAGPGNPKREKAKAIVMSYGKKVSDIPEDKRTEAMLKLIELEQALLEG